MKAAHALLTLIVGVGFGVTWLRAFWNRPNTASTAVLCAPLAAALLGLSHWVSYDFSLAHWASGFSFLQALFNVAVTVVLLSRRRAIA